MALGAVSCPACRRAMDRRLDALVARAAAGRVDDFDLSDAP